MIDLASLFRGALVGAVSFVLIAGLAPRSSCAQLSTDRPGFGDGSFTLGAGTVQAELGYAYIENGFSRHEIGQLLLRFGVTNALELRGGVGSYAFSESPFDNGYTGTSVGAKVRLFRNSVSSLSGVAMLGLPTETGGFDSPDDRARQDVKIAFDGALGEEVMLSVNGGTRFFYDAGEKDDRAVEWVFVPTLSINITPSLITYFGYAGFYADVTNRHWVESGLTLLRSADTQLDANTGIQVGDGDGFFVGGGLVHRF